MDDSLFVFTKFTKISLAIREYNAFLDDGDVLFAGRQKGIQSPHPIETIWELEGSIIENRAVMSASNVAGWNKVYSICYPRKIGGDLSFLFAKEGLVTTAIAQWTEYGKTLRGKKIGFLPVGCRDNQKVVNVMAKAVTDIASILAPIGDLQYPDAYFTSTEFYLYTLTDSDKFIAALEVSDQWRHNLFDL
jgi:hypothetical protein